MTTIYHKRYRKLIDHYKSIVCEGYTERHHIIPKCMGGDNSEDNLVDLPAKAHYIAHLLLTKMYPENKLLMYAFAAMGLVNDFSNTKRSEYINSRRYEKMRSAGLEARSYKCIIDGIEFPSVNQASKYYGVSGQTIIQWQIEGGKSRDRLGEGCIIDGQTFVSKSSAARYYKVSQPTITCWLLKGGKSFPTDDKCKSCVVRGIRFSSIKEAAAHYKVKPPTIRRWIKNEHNTKSTNNRRDRRRMEKGFSAVKI